MGKRDLPSKARREQLRQKRLAKDAGALGAAVTAAGRPRRQRGDAPGVPVAGQSSAQRYRLMFAADSAEARAEQRKLAHVPVRVDSSEHFVERTMDVQGVRPFPDPRFRMPLRPTWRYSDSVNAVDKRELTAFREWMQSVERSDERAAYFEQNLETWRQLWRVIERSDVLVLVADIRFPALHFVPDLYHYVTVRLKKGMVLALNKCDLVPADVLLAWKSYFENKYPGMAVALFSSFPDAKLAPSNDNNAALLSKRERRMARSKLAAWGADQLLAAVDSLPLPAEKKAYLEQWRTRMAGTVATSSDDDDEHEHDLTFLHAHAARVDKRQHASQGAKDENETHGPQQRRRRRRRCAQPSASKPLAASSRSRVRTPIPKSVTDSDAQSDSDDQNVHNGSDSTNRIDDDEDGVCDGMITIGIVGHPNTGKSSMINGVFRRKVVSTSRTPGHTKHLQTIFLSNSVRLCDCPGLVFPGLASRELQILAGMYPISQVREPYAAIKYLADRVPLVDILGLNTELEKLAVYNEEPHLGSDGWTAWKICEAWAMKRGFYTAKAARLDVFRAANSILRLALDGRIVLATIPPGFAPTRNASPEDTLNLHAVDATLLSASTQTRAVLSGDYSAPSSGAEVSDENSSSDADGDLVGHIENRGTSTDKPMQCAKSVSNAFSLLCDGQGE